jgi:asparagine synthase (glutamine-hydrolysing)
MCGLHGYHGDVPADLLAMQRSVAPRGPDFLCLERGPGFALGMARLRVADVDPASDPPWRSPDGAISALLNGEITNHAELRRLLVGRGHSFRSRSDGELLPALYARYGPAFPGMLRGPFALAVLDRTRDRLLLARDRFGKKPLVYAERPGAGLLFASDVRSILAARVVEPSPDPASVRQYLADGFVRAPRTVIEGVRMLPPGHALVHDAGGTVLSRFADVAPARAIAADREIVARQIDAALARAVSARLESPRRKAILLSGGLDSGLIAWFARAHDPEITCVTMRTGLDESEVSAAQRTAAHLGLRTEVIDLALPAPDGLAAFAARLGEPIGDSSALACDALFAALEDRCAVALAGEGGDELFYGYRRVQALALSELPLVRRLALMAQGEPNVTGARGRVHELRRFSAGVRRPQGHRLAFWRSLFDDARIAELCPGAPAAETAPETGLGRRGMLARATLEEVRGPLQGLLAKVDRTSMAHGIEVRCPFLDEEVVESALAAPVSALFAFGRTKPLLRRLARGRLPPSVVRRRKTGFGVPVAAWLRRTDIAGLARDVIERASLVDRAAAQRILAEHLSGAVDHGQRLFALVTLELWFGSVREAPRA